MQSSTRTIVVHIGPTKFGSTFDWANCEDTLRDKIVLTIGCVTQPDSDLFAHMTTAEAQRTKTRLDQLHLRKIDLAHETLVINLTDYIGSSTLHELCYSFNHKKIIRWLEDWPMYCSRCRCRGPQSQHFFHTSMRLRELDTLLDGIDDTSSPYLVGQLVEWYGQIAPIVRLGNGELVLQVDLHCTHCSQPHETYYAVRDRDGSFCQLVNVEGTYLADMRSADERNQVILCAACACQPIPHQYQVLRRLIIRRADHPGEDITKIVPVHDLPAVVRPLWDLIAADDFERLALRKGLTEFIITPYVEEIWEPAWLQLWPPHPDTKWVAPWCDLPPLQSSEELEFLTAVTQLYLEMGSVPARTAILERLRQNRSAGSGWSRKQWPLISAFCEKYSM
ncbi:MAG: hypothetical protein H0U76_29950 [Ktedonobacteraceae bacterium]|nr:hypothetical protein [Ktedonobacteraceae bacterium]